MKTENTLSAIALLFAGLSVTDVVNVSVAIIVATTAVIVNLQKRKAEKARMEKELAERDLLNEQLKELHNEE